MTSIEFRYNMEQFITNTNEWLQHHSLEAEMAEVEDMFTDEGYEVVESNGEDKLTVKAMHPFEFKAEVTLTHNWFMEATQLEIEYL